MRSILPAIVACVGALVWFAVPADAQRATPPLCAFERAAGPDESLSALLARHPAFTAAPRFTGGRQTWWCRIDAAALPHDGDLIVDDASDVTVLWSRRPDGTYTVERSGTAVPQAQKPLRAPGAVFPLVSGATPAYVRIHGNFLAAISAVSSAGYAEIVNARLLRYATIIFYIGILMAAGIYHIANFAFTRSRETLWYAIYIALLIFDEFAYADGFGWMFVWPTLSVPRDAPQIWVVDGIVIALYGFVREFCRTRTRPRVDRLVFAVPAVFVVGDTALRVLGLLDAESYFSYIAFPLMQAVAIGIAYSTFRRGDRSALFVVVAFSAYLVGSTISSIAGVFGTFAAVQNPIVAFGMNYCWEIGAALEILMISLALAERVRQAYGELEAGLVDPLTGARNRRYLLKQIDLDLSLVARNSDFSLTFLLVDIDHFKAVNDRHGHAAGDAVLAQVSARLASVMRESDYLVRWGGEEFLIVCRGRERSEASVLAERVRVTVASRPYVLENGETLAKTCSIGFACYPLVPSRPDAATWLQVIEVADRALYLAKNGGRNAWAGVAIASSVQPDPTNGPVVDVESAVARGEAGVSKSFNLETVERA